MRVTGSILALSLLVSAAPAFAQGGGTYDTGNPYNRQYTNQNRYEYYPQPGPGQQGQYGQNQQGPWQQGSPYQQGGSWRQGQYGQNQQGPWQHGGNWQPGQQGPMPYGPQGGNAPYRMGQSDQYPHAPVSSSTQTHIRQSLESSGFKNVAVMPQSFLIRATAPDGSKVLMQVSSESLFGVVVNQTGQGGTGGTSSSTGSASSGNAGSAGNASAGNTSNTGNTGTGSTSAENTSSTGGAADTYSRSTSSPGASAQTPSSSTMSQSPQASTAPVNVSESQIKQAQEQLKSAGLYKGTADGKIGPDTKQAISEFQQQHGMTQTGMLDQETLAALNNNQNGAGSSLSGSTTQPSGSGTMNSSAAPTTHR